MSHQDVLPLNDVQVYGDDSTVLRANTAWNQKGNVGMPAVAVVLMAWCVTSLTAALILGFGGFAWHRVPTASLGAVRPLQAGRQRRAS